MKLHLARTASQNTFTGYGEGYVMVNGVRYEASVIVMPARPVELWNVSSLELLDETSASALVTLGAEVLLIGTGQDLRFPERHILRALAAAGIGVEIMDTTAACRTYNILAAEERNVLAAVMV